MAWLRIYNVSYDIYGRTFFPNGTALTNEFQINQNTRINQQSPSVASLLNETVFVAWEDMRNVYGRIFCANGTAISNEFNITQYTSSIISGLSTAALTNQNVFVAWSGYQTGNWSISGRLFSANGTALGNEFGINQNSTGQAFPSVARLPNGNVFAAWDNVGGNGIHGRILFQNGTGITNEFGINQNSTGARGFPSVASLPNGNAFVAWEGRQTGTFQIYGRIFFPNGTALGNEFDINQNTTFDHYTPSVTSLTNGNVFVVWGYQLYGRLFSPSGIGLSDEFGINQNTTGSPGGPSVAGLTNENVFVAWEAAPTGTEEVYGRVFNNDTLTSLLTPTPAVPTPGPTPAPTSSPTPFPTPVLQSTSAPPFTSETSPTLLASSGQPISPTNIGLEVGIPLGLGFLGEQG